MKKKYLKISQDLKNNTEILENTFKKYNLKVLQCSYSFGDDGNCDFYIEISSIDETILSEDICIKINLYDNNGEIIYSASNDIKAGTFDGYDTINLILWYNALKAEKARVFVHKIKDVEKEIQQNYFDNSQELKNNTEIIENTFKKHNLQVLKYSYRDGGWNPDDCTLSIEFSSIDDTIKLSENIVIKLNLYDENGEIVSTSEEKLYKSDFEGYDTIEICASGCRALTRAKSARIFVVKF